jgi:hypothetical protein
MIVLVTPIRLPNQSTKTVTCPSESVGLGGTQPCRFAYHNSAHDAPAARKMYAESFRVVIIAGRDDRSSEGLAIGSSGFVSKVKKELGARAMRRQATEMDATFTLREPEEAYSDVRRRTWWSKPG